MYAWDINAIVMQIRRSHSRGLADTGIIHQRYRAGGRRAINPARKWRRREEDDGCRKRPWKRRSYGDSERVRDTGKSGATDTSGNSERTISRVRIIYARNYVAAGACKLIGKMVVKVNLVGSQGSGSRLAQVVRARMECSVEWEGRIRASKKTRTQNLGRNTEK